MIGILICFIIGMLATGTIGLIAVALLREIREVKIDLLIEIEQLTQLLEKQSVKRKK